MVGISKKPVEGWQRFKLCRWTYSGYERHYFSAENELIAKSYARQRARNWNNAELIPVHPEQKGFHYLSIWKKHHSKC